MRPEDIDKLTDEEIRALMLSPMSEEEVARLREIREADRWLLALNLREMENDGHDGDSNG